MFIKRTGSGPRFFFGIHGWSGDHHTFDPVTADLPADVSFFSIDLPGCGESLAPNEWTVSAVAQEIADEIRRLPAPVSLVGNCSGALLGIAAAQRAGDHVEGLALIDMFATFPWYFRIFLSKPIGRYAYATTFRNPIGRWFTNLSLRGKRKEDNTLTGGFARVDHDATYRYLQMFDRFPSPASFASLSQPVNLLYGEKTFQAIRDSVPVWKSVWPHAVSTCLRGAGHLPILEATLQLRESLFGDQKKEGYAA